MKLASAGKSWFVAWTLSGDEEKAAENLRLAGFETYLPRRRKEIKNKRTNTWRTITEPVMPYLFINMPEGSGHQHFGKARVKGVQGFLGAQGVPEPIDGNEVVKIQVAEMNGKMDEMRGATTKDEAKAKFPIGSPVEIPDGVFAGFAGFVAKHEKTGRIKIDVSAFGRAFTVDADPEKLRPAA